MARPSSVPRRPALPQIPIERHVLDNGLRIVLSRDEAALDELRHEDDRGDQL